MHSTFWNRQDDGGTRRVRDFLEVGARPVTGFHLHFRPYRFEIFPSRFSGVIHSPTRSRRLHIPHFNSEIWNSQLSMPILVSGFSKPCINLKRRLHVQKDIEKNVLHGRFGGSGHSTRCFNDIHVSADERPLSSLFSDSPMAPRRQEQHLKTKIIFRTMLRQESTEQQKKNRRNFSKQYRTF